MKIYFICFVLLIGSCEVHKNSIDNLFTESVELYAKSIPIPSDSIVYPFYMSCLDNYLITASYRAEKVIRIYDLEHGNVVNDVISIGRAGNEILDFSSVSQVDGKFSIYSPRSNKVISINKSEISGSDTLFRVDMLNNRWFRLVPLNNHYYLALRHSFIVDKNIQIADHQFILLDSAGNALSSFESFPGNPTEDVGDKVLAYQGHLCVDPTGRFVVFASSFGLVMKFFEFTNSNSIIKNKEYIFELPKYTTESSHQQYSITWDKECYRGILAMASSEKYCFCLYKEKGVAGDRDIRGNVIFVFDWQGNPVRKYKLDNQALLVAYCESESKLIALTIDESGNYSLIYFPLS